MHYGQYDKSVRFYDGPGRSLQIFATFFIMREITSAFIYYWANLNLSEVIVLRTDCSVAFDAADSTTVGAPISWVANSVFCRVIVTVLVMVIPIQRCIGRRVKFGVLPWH